MSLWILVPIDSHHPSWEMSTLCKWVIIRAENQINARKIATLEFVTARRKTSKYDDSPICGKPWEDDNLTRIDECDDDRFTATGPEELLHVEEL